MDAMYGTNATVDDVDVALQSLMRSLKQTRLRDYLRARAGVDLDQAGLAALYALHTSESSLRLTELAERPTGGHAELYDDVHQRLQEVLAQLDQQR